MEGEDGAVLRRIEGILAEDGADRPSILREFGVRDFSWNTCGCHSEKIVYPFRTETERDLRELEGLTEF